MHMTLIVELLMHCEFLLEWWEGGSLNSLSVFSGPPNTTRLHLEVHCENTQTASKFMPHPKPVRQAACVSQSCLKTPIYKQEYF